MCVCVCVCVCVVCCAVSMFGCTVPVLLRDPGHADACENLPVLVCYRYRYCCSVELTFQVLDHVFFVLQKLRRLQGRLRLIPTGILCLTRMRCACLRALASSLAYCHSCKRIRMSQWRSQHYPSRSLTLSLPSLRSFLSPRSPEPLYPN